MYGLTDSDLEIIRTLLKKYPSVKEAIIFGSRAKGTNRPGSDVDIALKGEEPLTEVILQISTYLNQESLLPYQFDIVDYTASDNEELIHHIDRVGKSIYRRFAE
jgi:predicted nucleotidyltransferase